MASKSDNAENGGAPTTPKAGAGAGACAAAAAAAAGGFDNLTSREQEILAKAMTCLKTTPEVGICTKFNLS